MLVIGSRGSALARWQATWVQARLKELGEDSRIEIIRTTGDKIQNVPLSQVGAQTGGKGLFTKEIEEALLAGAIDLAVHSLKDMPTELPEGLALAATPAREDPRDALIGAKLQDVPVGARVGTSSLRRSAQLHALRPDLDVQTIRGNVDTRLRKLDEGQFSAIVLASAGLRRLGLESRAAELLDPLAMCPAAGQGALAIETRDDGDDRAFRVCSTLDDPLTRACITAERALLAAMGGGCQVPIGAYARPDGAGLFLIGVVASPDGARLIRDEARGSLFEAEALGRGLGNRLFEAGGREILEVVYARSGP